MIVPYKFRIRIRIFIVPYNFRIRIRIVIVLVPV